MIRVHHICFLATVFASYNLNAEEINVEFLEFIGEWQASDGQWQDPEELMLLDDSDLQKLDSQQIDSQQIDSQEQSNEKTAEVKDHEE